MSFDVNIFSNIKEEITVYVHSDIDASALRVLFSNCLRLGGTENKNVSIATVHPSVWFSEMYETFSECLSIVPKTPTYQLIRIEDNQVVNYSFTTETKTFESDEQIKYFFEKECEFKSISIFAICKYCDLSTLKFSWVLKFNDITSINTLRDNKINSIINI